MDQSFEIPPTIDGIDAHKPTLNSKSSLSSSHTPDRLLSKRKGTVKELTYFLILISMIAKTSKNVTESFL